MRVVFYAPSHSILSRCCSGQKFLSHVPAHVLACGMLSVCTYVGGTSQGYTGQTWSKGSLRSGLVFL